MNPPELNLDAVRADHQAYRALRYDPGALEDYMAAAEAVANHAPALLDEIGRLAAANRSLAALRSVSGRVAGARALAEMTAEVRANNIAQGWRDKRSTFGDYIALLHSELSEALEAYRDHRLADATKPACGMQGSTGNACAKHGPAKPEGVGSELADVLIRLLDMADVYGIDLHQEYTRKMAYNRTRPYQHGGRTLAGPSQSTGTGTDEHVDH